MIKIEYGVVTQGAKEKLMPEIFNCASISNVGDLSKEDLIFENFCNPCEEYSVLLDGSCVPIPEDTESENMGIWSLYKANVNGEFEEVLPIIELISEELINIDGLTLSFDTARNVYPTNFVLKWYNKDELLGTENCVNSSAIFFLEKNIDGFDKLRIEFTKMNTPYSRMKLHAIKYGSIFVIEGESIKSLRVHQAINPISTTIPESNFNLVFVNNSNINYNFSERQSLKIYNNDEFIGKYFIENATQTSRKRWNIQAQDYIKALDGIEFEGGIYVEELATNILTQISNKSNVLFVIAENLQNAKVTGYIPYTTCRNALQQVLFAIGAYARTAYSENLEILSADFGDIYESIGFDRIYTGQSVSIDADITEIELVAHSYTATNEEIILHQAEVEEEEIKVIFSQPAYNLSITNEDGEIIGEIIKEAVNYAIISCPKGAVLKGLKYEHSTFSKSKSNTSSNKNSNKKKISNATLISRANIDNILNICYNYIARNKTVKSKVVESDIPLIVGKTYEIETELFGNVTGVLSEQSFSLLGGKKIAKETVIK